MNIEQGKVEEARVRSPGTTQGGMRLYNERLVLSLIRRHGELPKAELARLTGLSAQTVSVIVRQLEEDGLLIKGEPQRGKVGQPLVPFRLDPDGAFSLGLKVGRRSGELVMLDLSGNIRATLRKTYQFPAPDELLTFAKQGLAEILGGLSAAQRKRISGLGIASPFELWNWQEEIGGSPEGFEAWRTFDLTAEVAKLCDFPVLYCNDATAACAAELLFGKGRAYQNFAYLFVGHFIGGGTVINGSIFPGRTGYSGAFAAMPTPTASGRVEQMVRHASLYLLENAIRAQGGDPMMVVHSPDDWSRAEPALSAWIDATAASLAQAALASMAVVEFDAVIIDGALPAAVRVRLVAKTKSEIELLDRRGLPSFVVDEGSIGRDARAIGAASLPLFANFIIDRDVLFKETAPT